MPHHAEIQEQGISLAFDETSDLGVRLFRSCDRSMDERMIEGYDQAAAIRPQNTAQANLLSVLTHGLS